MTCTVAPVSLLLVAAINNGFESDQKCVMPISYASGTIDSPLSFMKFVFSKHLFLPVAQGHCFQIAGFS
jgi:hypothetical protein